MKDEYSAYMSSVEIDDSYYIHIDNIVNDVVWGILHFWLLILLIASMAASIGFFRVKNNYIPTYLTSATMVIDVSTGVSYDSKTYYETTISQIANTFPYIISNNALKNMIAKDLGLSYVPARIYAEALSETNLFTIYVRTYDPQLAYDILQSVLKNYPIVAKAVIGNTQMTIVDESGIPTEPINHDTSKRTAAVYMLLATAACIIFLFLYSLLKKTIRKEDDFRNILNVRCFGSIPQVKTKIKNKVKGSEVLISNRRVSYDFKEAIRILRTRLEVDHKETGAQVYLISSSLAGEGKSTLSINIALSLVDVGHRVILADMDIRNPSLLKILGKETPETGLSDIINGKKELEEVLVSLDMNNIWLLPQGTSRNNMGEILYNNNLSKLFDELKGKADYIILDTAPSALLSDASALAGYADACIYVVSQDFAPISLIKEGLDLLYESGVRIAGCVLNKTRMGVVGSGTGYGYAPYVRRNAYRKYNEDISD